jgi:hypothetical protein
MGPKKLNQSHVATDPFSDPLWRQAFSTDLDAGGVLESGRHFLDGQEHHKREEYAKRRRRHSEEVDRDDVLDMVVEKHPPRLRRRLAWANSVLVDGGLGDNMAQQREFGLDPRRPHNGFSRDMRRIRLRISALIFGRPTLPVRDFHRQYSLNPCRCHPTSLDSTSGKKRRSTEPPTASTSSAAIDALRRGS